MEPYEMTSLRNVLERAFALHQQGNAKEAEQLYTQVLKADPRQFDALHLLGLLKHQQGNNTEGLRLIGAALKIKPDYADAVLNYGSVLAALERHEEALVYFDRAVATNPSSPRALNNRGNSLAELMRFDEALSCFDKALAIDPDYANCLVNRARMLVDIGRYAEAIPTYTRALKFDPEDADSQMHKGYAELSLGNFPSGWKGYEWRWKSPTAPAKWHFSLPRWKGEHVKGTIVAWGEQGLGDEILFASMIPDLVPLADSVVLDVEPRLKKLLARSFPQVEVIGRGEPLPRPAIVQSPLGSLGQYLRLSWEAFPRRDSGYVVPDPDRTAELRGRLSPDGRPVIGLSWVSKNPKFAQFKSARLSDFQSVLQLAGCRFIDLQYGDTLAEREALKETTGIIVERLEDIDNTNDIEGLAALISACDLVVTVSNTTAHLAGALGKPTVLFVPHTGRTWYWFSQRPDSPWYPRMHVNRQKHGQSWKDLIDRTAGEVAGLVESVRIGQPA
jgi:tetratricopeptide (TPR) repeat protein